MMHSARLLAVALLSGLSWPQTALSYDEFSDERSPPRFVIKATDGSKLILKGWLGLSLRDLEGEGGAGRDSITDTATIGTRSGHAALDGARIALRVQTPSKINAFSVLAFTEDEAYLHSAWLDHRASLTPELETHTELGLHTPFVNRDPMSGREPLLSMIYWGTSEAHLTTELRYRRNDWRGWLGLSAAIMRPLATRAINRAASQRGVISVLTYDRARPFSGNAPVLGAKVGVAWRWIQFESFGFKGHLAAEAGIDELRNRIAHFVYLPEFDSASPRRQDPSFWWWGGRLQSKHPNWKFLVEGVRSRESLLSRWGLSAEGAYVFRFARYRIPRTFELRLRAERYRIHGAADALADGVSLRSPDPSQALTWDYDLVSFFLASELVTKTIWLRLEHSLIREFNDAPALGRANAPFLNDETTLGFEVRY